MSQGRARIAIVGGGLGGLVAALRLQQQGAGEVVLFEARHRLGGRILSVDGSGAGVDTTVDTPAAAQERFDLGPSWFWPSLQPALDRLVHELGLERLAQHEAGDLLVERSPREAPMRLRGPASEPPSMRLAGGTGALVAALQRRLAPGTLRTGATVRRLQHAGDAIGLQVEDASGATTTRRAAHVLLALPPRLAVQSLAFDPPLPAELARRWQATPTWMAPHAKYLAIYDTPFWRAQGLSGAARSAHGPMGEIHDASAPGGPAALFGFLGVPAPVRRGVPDEVLRAHCRAQLVRLFGERAATPRAEALKDWSADPLTATEDDLHADGHHSAAPPAAADQGAWAGWLTGVASEWSPQFPGYLAGAVEAAERGVERALGSAPPSGAGFIDAAAGPST